MNVTHIEPVGSGKIGDSLFAVKSGPVNFFLYEYDNGYIAFDSGYRTGPTIRQLALLGVDPGNVTHLFLTHSDVDHTGGADLFHNARIFLSADEEQMITGDRKRMLGFVKNPRLKRSYEILNDADEVAIGALAVRAIATPGHTPGSMSYLLNGSMLFVGDALKLLENRAYPLRNHINVDTAQAKESIRKLARLPDIGILCNAHTGYTVEFDEAMAAWR